MTATVTDLPIAPWQDRAKPWIGALHEALKLAGNGIPVFPCGADKTPRVKGGFKAASTDPHAIRAMWWKECVLVGAPTGAVSNIFVLDIDSARHDEASDWLERHSPYLPETRQHETKSGGMHLLFQHHAGLKNSASKLAIGVDTRGDGGFVIWWPAALGLAAFHKFLPLAPLPDWLLEQLTPPPKPFASYTAGPYTAYRPKHPGASTAQLQGILALVAGAREGERNAITFWAACRIIDMIAAGELNQGDGTDALRALAEAASRTGLPYQEIERVIASAMRTAA